MYILYTINKAYVLERISLDDVAELKEVDINLLDRLYEYKDFHEQSFSKVVDSILEDERESLESFDFYFNETKKVAKWVLENLR